MYFRGHPLYPLYLLLVVNLIRVDDCIIVLALYMNLSMEKYVMAILENFRWKSLLLWLIWLRSFLGPNRGSVHCEIFDIFGI